MNKKVALFFVFLGIFLITGCTQQGNYAPADDNSNNAEQKSFPTLEITDDLKIPLPKDIPVLMYHHVGSIPKDENNLPLRMDLTVPAKNFEEQLKWLTANDYETVGINEAVAFANEKDGYWSPLSSFAWPQKPIVITFDDGYRDSYTDALPLLQKYNMRGSFSIITDKVGTPGYLSWEEIKELQLAGMEITSHSISHPDSTIQMRSELKKSRRILEAHDIYPINIFVYPSGKYDSFVIKQLKTDGYIGARTTKEGRVTKESDAYELPTVRIHGAVTMEKFAELLQ